MFAYDKTFDPKEVLGHCGLIAWFSDFAFILPLIWFIFILFVQIISEYNPTLDPKILIGHCGLFSRFSDFALYLGTQLVDEHTSFTISDL